MPFARDLHDAVVLDGGAWVTGGRNAANQMVGELWRYDFSSNTWSTGFAPLPTPRVGVRLFRNAGWIYAIGGNDGTANPSPVEMYDPSANLWSSTCGSPAGCFVQVPNVPASPGARLEA